MQNIQRKDIHLISRNSRLSGETAERILQEQVYNNRPAWRQFLRFFLATLSIGFTTAGIVFFFAYNWADLNKFVKIGLITALVVIATVFALLSKININIRKIILTGAAVLVGVLFAVFGQVYQTGADAYDFFLAWTVFITFWVLAAGFAPLSLLYLILVNTTIILYSEQVARHWSVVFLFILLFVLDSLVLIVAILLARFKPNFSSPDWFRKTIALASVSFATLGMINAIFDRDGIALSVAALITAGLYTLGIRYALKIRSLFYLSIAFSLVVIISAFLLEKSGGSEMLLLVSLFIIGSVTAVIKGLIELQKKWANEN